jgi:hypothetical protein
LDDPPVGRLVRLSCLLVAGCALGGCGRLLFERQGAADAALEDGGVDDAGALDAGPAPDFCATVPGLEETPAIDGIADADLRWQDITPVGWTGPTAIPDGERARFSVAWVPNGLYFAIEVDDPTRVPAPDTTGAFCGDSIELYVDDDGVFSTPTTYDNPGTRQMVAGAPASDVEPIARGSLHRYPQSDPWPGEYVARPRPGGYVVEAFVGASELGLSEWTLARGQQIGLDVSINVSMPGAEDGPNCGYRLGQYFLRTTEQPNACGGAPYCDPRAFCAPALD